MKVLTRITALVVPERPCLWRCGTSRVAIAPKWSAEKPVGVLIASLRLSAVVYGDLLAGWNKFGEQLASVAAPLTAKGPGTIHAISMQRCSSAPVGDDNRRTRALKTRIRAFSRRATWCNLPRT
jgi:hypothetical protein